MKITDALIKKSCSKTIYARGMEYFREGRVHLRKREENLINAVVDGKNLYNVQVKFDKNGLTDYFCTCPYYETMSCVCKHIVATLKQRQTELEEGVTYNDENDKLAQMICGEYAARKDSKQMMCMKFIMYISHTSQNNPTYGMELEIDNDGTRLHGIENFLYCYINEKEFLIDKNKLYHPHNTIFPQPQKEILDILAETYENREAGSSFYVKAAYQTTFGKQSAKRIFPLLKLVDFTIVYDNMTLGNLQIIEDDPDILLDVAAADGEITMAVSERGVALTPDGEWFMHQQNIYHTTPKWREYYMPIYKSMATEGRTHISFRGDNTMLFAKHVLPEIKKRSDVVVHGIDKLIINEEPEFKIYFDEVGRGISAAIIASYGSISLRLPAESETHGRIVVRDYAKEDEILGYFSGFSLENNSYILNDDDAIFDFMIRDVPKLWDKAEIFASDSFKRIKIENSVDITASVSYNYDINIFEAGYESNLSYGQIREILNAVKLKKRFYRLKNGSFIDLINNTERTLLTLMEQMNFSDEELKNGSKVIEHRYALFLDAIDEVVKDTGFRNYIEKIKNIEPQIPKNLENVLRGYQYDGVQWMKQLSMLGLGGILADDMGLGKTLQVLAYIHGEKPSKPTLIITPSALTYNWLSEINRFIPDASAIIIDGAKDERTALIEKIESYEFIITSYPLMRRDIGMYKKISFSYCFIDEAQHIKNYKTMNAQSVKKIKAERRFALTGTPIENSLMELWSIFDFIMPGYLHSAREFREKYEYSLSKNGDEQSNMLLRAKIRPFILRRMKKDVLAELPEKIENTMYADLTAEQKKVYSAYLSLAKDKTYQLIGEGGRNKMQILTLIMRLRQICCHPVLFDEAYEKDSGKLNLLIELVENAVQSGHRVLVFSQFVSMLKIIDTNLREKGIRSFYLDGATPPYERAEQTDRFNGGERDVFLISLKAGGTGLNLTGADMVIHYEPWWNPAIVDQASDRAYRIGQTKAVQVIRLAASGTIEEKILKLQEMKRSFAEDIIPTNAESFKNLTDEEILDLFE